MHNLLPKKCHQDEFFIFPNLLVHYSNYFNPAMQRCSFSSKDIHNHFAPEDSTLIQKLPNIDSYCFYPLLLPPRGHLSIVCTWFEVLRWRLLKLKGGRIKEEKGVAKMAVGGSDLDNLVYLR